MSDGTKAFRMEIPIVINYEIGLDPAGLPKHKVSGMAAVQSLYLCESLFWVVQQLGAAASHDGWIFRRGDLFEAMERIGEIGRAIATAASDHVQHLEHLAERSYRQGGIGCDDERQQEDEGHRA